MSLCLVGIYTTRLAKTYQVIFFSPTFNQSSVFLIYVFVQYSQSDLPPVRSPWGEAPGRDSNP